MIDYLILSLTVLYFFLGLVQYFIAPKIGPNPYLGFKIGYTFADREVWDKTNRLMGKFMMVHSLLLFPLCLIPDFLGYFLLIFIVPLVAFIPFGIRYAAVLLEMKGARERSNVSERRMEPITLPWTWAITPVLFYVVLLMVEFVTYPSLPDLIAIHFDFHGNPNGWSTKWDFLILYSLLSLVLVVVSYLFVYLGRRYPLYLHPGKMRFPRDTYLKMAIISMDSMLVLMLVVYMSIYSFAMGNSLYPVSWLFGMAILIVMIPILYLIYKWRR